MFQQSTGNDMNVNDHERLSNSIFRNKLKVKDISLIVVLHHTVTASLKKKYIWM